MCMGSQQNVFRDREGTVPVDENDEIGFIGIGKEAMLVKKVGSVFLPPALALTLQSRGSKRSVALLELPDMARAA
mgnify:CR=1 FL=1